MKKLLLSIAVALSVVALVHCGDDEGGCPGRVCTDCGGFGDCDLTCESPDVNFCGAFGYFDDPGLRCTFCAPPDFQP